MLHTRWHVAALDIAQHPRQTRGFSTPRREGQGGAAGSLPTTVILLGRIRAIPHRRQAHSSTQNTATAPAPRPTKATSGPPALPQSSTPCPPPLASPHSALRPRAPPRP